MLYQRTIAKKISITGIGIHSGKKTTMTLNPSPVNSGIIFKRSDLKNAPLLKATINTVGATENNTTLGKGENSIHTVEHILSVLYGFSIDNLLIEIDGPEVPTMDGSSGSFIFVIKETGIQILEQAKNFLVVLRPIEISLDEKWAKIEPYKNLIIDSTIVFQHPLIKTQNRVFEFSCQNYITEIGRARTFGFLKDVDMLKRKGLAKGGSLDNCIVMDDFKVINSEGLRFQDEFIRHKILDTIGDFSLLGYEIAGKITTYKSGHNLHNLLCKKLLENPSAYKIISSTSFEEKSLDSIYCFK